MNMQIPCSALPPPPGSTPAPAAAAPSQPVYNLSTLVARWQLTQDPKPNRRIGKQMLETTRVTIPHCEYRDGPYILRLRTYNFDGVVRGSFELIGHQALPFRGVLVFNDFIPQALNDDPIGFFKKIADMR